MKTITTAIIIAIACAACSNAPQATEYRNVASAVARLPDAGSMTSVYRVDDQERGVTCYVSDGYKSGGISCIKLN